MDMSEIILSGKDIYREFRMPDTTLAVLKGLSIQMRAKDMAAVTGASGVGKSTLLHILGGLDRPSSGDVLMRGQSLNSQDETQLARLRNDRIGFVFQFHYLLEDFSALENVMIPMLVGGKKRELASERAEHLLEKVGLSGRTKHLPMQLSGGEQQRVAVARALANDPEIVLADEPSGNLDTATGRRLHDLLFHLNTDANVTFLIATHNRELAQECGRQLEIVDGRIRETK